MPATPSQRTPLHEKVYRELRAQIDSGDLSEGQQLPTEVQLAKSAGVSRGTARQAVSRLVSEGVIVRTAGRGTFVSSRRLTYTARELLGFTEQIRASGRVPSSKLIDLSIVDVNEFAAEFDFGPNVEKALSIERVRLADNEAVALEHLLLPWPRFAGLKDVALESLSIYDSLEEYFGVRLQVGDFVLDVKDLTHRQAELLREEERSPVFLMHGTVYDQETRPIVGVRCYYSRNKYSFRFSVPREPHQVSQFVPPRLVLST
jgi:GntR family transcriptional regulator